jgi:PhnB protein
MMTSRLNPYISFGGDARQAMEFYKEVLGGTLTLSTFGESGAPDTPEADNQFGIGWMVNIGQPQA